MTPSSSAPSSRTSTVTGLPPSLPPTSTGSKFIPWGSSTSYTRNLHRSLIVLVDLFIGVECFFMMAVASNPFFADGNKKKFTFFCFMVGHSICLIGSLFLAGAVCAQKIQVLGMNILLFTLYTMIYMIFSILMFIGNSKTSIQAAFIFAAFASIGIFGICATLRYLHVLTNDERLNDPVGAAVRNAKHVAKNDKHFQAALQQHQKHQQSPTKRPPPSTSEEIQLQVAKELVQLKDEEGIIVEISVDNTSSRTNTMTKQSLPHLIV